MIKKFSKYHETVHTIHSLVDCTLKSYHVLLSIVCKLFLRYPTGRLSLGPIRFSKGIQSLLKMSEYNRLLQFPLPFSKEKPQAIERNGPEKS